MDKKSKPDWAGESLLSNFVNLLIQTKPIYGVMKQQARQVLIKTAEKNGIPWRKNYEALQVSPAKKLLAAVTNPHVIYPDYYKVPFTLIRKVIYAGTLLLKLNQLPMQWRCGYGLKKT